VKRLFCVLLLLLSMAVLLPMTAFAQAGGPGTTIAHIVQPGETLFSIARRYGTTVDAITHVNGISDPRRIYVGQRLLIPATIEPPAAWVTHIVRPGETLQAIAGQYGAAWRTVALANRIVNPYLLGAGQVLQLPVNEERAIAGAIYAVQPGETLTGIAFRYGLSSQELAAANGLANPALLLPGQWLLIPGQRPAWMPTPFVSIDLSPLPVRQGQTVRIAVRTDRPVNLTGVLFDRPLRFAEEGGVYYALVGVHAFTEPGLYELTLTATDAEGEQAAVGVGLLVEEGAYGYERIDVPDSRSNLLDAALVVAERERMAEVQSTFSESRYWHGPLRQPVEAAISSYFGTRRSYEGGPYNSFHAGIDFNAGAGTAVRASADGVVVLAEPLTVRGNAIVIDHGWGLLTGYWHLSSIEVAVGQTVRAGDLIGRVGNTGLSTGAHLHWEVLVGGISVDGRQWLAPGYPWSDLDEAAGAATP